jgi:VanZ family protein
MLHRLLATAAWTAFALLVFVTISPLSMRPVVTADPNIERFAAFALVGLLFGLAYPRRLSVDASLVVIAAGVLEMLQLMIPDRHGHIADALVKAAGGAFGVAAAALIVLVVVVRRKGPVEAMTIRQRAQASPFAR